MKKRSIFSLLVAAALLLGCVLPSYASASSYTVEIQNKKMQVCQNGSVLRSYRLEEPDLVLARDGNGNLAVYFYREEQDYLSGVALPADTLTVQGTFSELKLDGSLDATCAVTVSGDVGAVAVFGPARVHIAPGSQVIKLLQYSPNAKITIGSNASIAQTYTLKAPTYTSAHETDANTQAPGTPIYDGNVRNPARPLLDVKINSSRSDGIDLKFDESTYTLSVTSKQPGLTVSQAIRGANFTARQPDGSSLEGRWDFHVGSASSTESGSYVYRFSPASSRYSPIDIKIRYRATQGPAYRNEGEAFVSNAPATVEISAVPEVETINMPLALLTPGYKLPIGASSIQPKLNSRTVTIVVPETAVPGDILRFVCEGKIALSETVQAEQIGKQVSFTVKTASLGQIEVQLVHR